jgi:hypothetical protein
VIRGRRPALIAGAVLLLLGFYVAVYPLHGYRVAVGSDTPVYVWWSRYAGTAGLGGLGTGPRAGLVGPLAALSTVLHIPEADLGAVLGPVLAVALALAAGALAEAAVGRSTARLVLTTLLSGMFLVVLAPGFYSTLAFGAAFVAGLATLTIGLEGRNRWPAAAAAACFAAAGLSHVLFMTLAAAVLGGGLLAVIPTSRRAVAAGTARRDSPAGRVVAASLGGAALVATGLGLEGSLAQVVTAGSDTPVTARDTVLRRTGLSSLVRASYRRKLLHDFSWYRTLVVLGTAFVPFAWTAPRRALLHSQTDRGGTRRWFFLGAVGAWLGVTLVGIVALAAGLPAPGQRLAASASPFPSWPASVCGASPGRRARGAARRPSPSSAWWSWGTPGWPGWPGTRNSPWSRRPP